MKTFVINKHGETLMPCSQRKARVLLKTGKAKVISRNPFTIQLIYGSSGYKQPLTLGVDTGHTEVGVSVISKTKEVFSATVKMRNDISKKMTNRKMYRQNRRSRLRYRKPRFNNRSASKRKGRLAPSVDWKVNAHKRIINKLKSLLPITKLILETATFDIAKINNPQITNKQYQQGIQYSYENIKAFVLSRDKYICQSDLKTHSKKLQVHHIIYKSKGGSNNPNNLITLCLKCHKKLHENKLSLNVKKHKSLKSATTMNIIRKRLLEYYHEAIETFGYITKTNRINLNLLKSHSNDAFVITKGTTQERVQEQNIIFKRKNNRSLQKNRNGFRRSIRKQRYLYQPKDIVQFENKTYSVIATQNYGKSVQITNGIKIFSKIPKKIKLIYHQKGIIFNF